MNEQMIQLADQAERHIAKTLTAVAVSQAPTFDGPAGEITMAYKLGLIDYPRRDELIGQLRVIVNYRRKQLNAERNAAIIGSAAK